MTSVSKEVGVEEQGDPRREGASCHTAPFVWLSGHTDRHTEGQTDRRSTALKEASEV